MRFHLQHTPTDTQHVRLHLSGPFVDLAIEKSVDLIRTNTGIFTKATLVSHTLKGGNILLDIRLECILKSGNVQLFHCDPLITLIGKDWTKEQVRQRLKGMVLEINNKGADKDGG